MTDAPIALLLVVKTLPELPTPALAPAPAVAPTPPPAEAARPALIPEDPAFTPKPTLAPKEADTLPVTLAWALSMAPDEGPYNPTPALAPAPDPAIALAITQPFKILPPLVHVSVVAGSLLVVRPKILDVDRLLVLLPVVADKLFDAILRAADVMDEAPFVLREIVVPPALTPTPAPACTEALTDTATAAETDGELVAALLLILVLGSDKKPDALVLGRGAPALSVDRGSEGPLVVKPKLAAVLLYEVASHVKVVPPCT